MIKNKTALHLATIELGEQGWRSGESARLPPMWPTSRLRCNMWAEFVGSLLCSERFFTGYSGFPSPQKPTFTAEVNYISCN